MEIYFATYGLQRWTVASMTQRQLAKTEDTACELLMAETLRKAGIRFRAQAHLPGKPDFLVSGTKLLIFVDGAFWHGFNFASWRWGLSAKWRDKIKRNMWHDKDVNRRLRASGWKVLRVWDHEIYESPKAVLLRVTAALG